MATLLASNNEKSVLVDGVLRPINNSLGYPLGSNMESIALFWRWFGNSPIVDEYRRPLVSFHGTRSVFTEFHESAEGNIGPGIYLTSKPNIASSYSGGWDEIREQETFDGAHVLMLYTNLRRPIIAINEDDLEFKLKLLVPESNDWNDIKNKLVELGHDGIWVQDNLSDEIVCYNSSSVRFVFDLTSQQENILNASTIHEPDLNRDSTFLDRACRAIESIDRSKQQKIKP